MKVNQKQLTETMRKLITELTEADIAYYKHDNPVMTDREYDMKLDQLRNLEEESGIILSGSPTQKVSGEILEELVSVRHTKPMLSAGKTKSIDDLVKFAGGRNVVLSWKMDGLTLVLRYENGVLQQAITRGREGIIGEDVTHTVRKFDNVPLAIPVQDSIEVRGEGVISWKNFEQINLSLEEPYGHPRNLASGSTRKLNAVEAGKRHLEFAAFELVTDMQMDTKAEQLDFMEKLGFVVVPHAKEAEEDSESGEADGTGENESGDENDDSSGKTSGESESDDDNVIPSQKMGNSGKQKTTENEQGRIPLAQTSSVSNPVGGTVSRDEDYERECDERAAADIERMLDKMAERSACKQLENERLQELNETAQNISYGNIHEGVEIQVKRISSVDEELVEQYDQVAGSLLAISKQMQKSLVKQLKESRRGGKMTGLLMGRRLDTHALCRNDGKVFYKNSLPNEIPEMAVGLLLDESGSMSSCDRCTYARATAIILYDFCRGLDIPVMIYGHSTGYDSSQRDTVDLYSYAEFESIDQDDQYRMMDISARGGNRDGAALRFVAEQLSKRPEEIKILMIVSDGQPADTGYGGTAAEEDLRGIRQEYQRKNIIFVAAAIGDDKQNIERIYGDSFMDITDLNQLPTKLTGVVRRHIRV